MERDLRVRSHMGALSRYYLDALLGLVAIRAHGAERSVRREHEGLLLEWASAGLGLQRAAVSTEALQSWASDSLPRLVDLQSHGAPQRTGGVLLLLAIGH